MDKNDVELILSKVAENIDSDCRRLYVCGTGPANKEEEEEVKEILKEIARNIKRNNKRKK